MMRYLKNTYYYILITSLFFILIFFFACKSSKNAILKDIATQDNPKLVFLNYILSNDVDNKKSISFINKVITEGKLKQHSKKYTNMPKQGDIKCIQLDENSSELQSVYIKNPLVKVFEVLNDSLQYSRHQIEQKKGALVLKLQLHPKAKYIALYNIIDTLQTSVKLIKTKI